MRFIALFLTLFITANQYAATQSVTESARQIPVIADVDVAVVGSSSAAVAAAVAAAENGATVYLACDRPYLGTDICRTQQLWARPHLPYRTAWEERIFTDNDALPPTTAFGYQSNIPAAPLHDDTDPPSRLNDGSFSQVGSESVQYNHSVQLTLDLGTTQNLKAVHLLTFQRPGDFAVADFVVSASPDGRQFKGISKAINEQLLSGELSERHMLTAAVPVQARYLRLDVHKPESYGRILLGEVFVETDQAPPSAGPLKPMQVKYALEQALLEAGVDFLYNTYATDVVRDETGQLAGIIVANRSGRQAIKAAAIIDASDKAVIVRAAELPLTKFQPSAVTVGHIVVGGTPPQSELKSTELKPAVKSGGTSYDARSYEFDVELTTDDMAAWSRLVNTIRDRTWANGQVAASEWPIYWPQRHISSQGNPAGKATAETIELTCFRPAGINNLFVLSPYADVHRDQVESLFALSHALVLGQRIGQAAARQNNTRTAAPLAVTASTGMGNVTGSVREFLNGPRNLTHDGATIASPARALPIWAHYDVVVVGGGTSGPPAGIAAARQGAAVLVIEHLDSLGGVGTNGLIGRYCLGYRGGFTQQVDRGLAELGGYAYVWDTEGLGTPWDVELKKEWWRQELLRAGGEIWFGASTCGTLVDDGRVTGVVVASPYGRGVVLADVVIDATGNSDVAAAAGVETVLVDDAHLAVQGTGLPPKNLGARYTNTDYSFVDDSDAADTWRMFVAARHKYRDAYDLAQLIDTRERRRIVGSFTIQPADIYNGRTYPDTIAQVYSNFDTHGYTVDPMFLVRETTHGEFLTAYVPYRALLPRDLDGLLVIGLGISAHRDAIPVLRMQPDVQNTGYAAGVAAALAVRNGVDVRHVDIKQLQHVLVATQCLPDAALDFDNPHPLPSEKLQEAVAQLPHNGSVVTILFAEPERSRSLLRRAYDAAVDADAKLIYAHTLAAMGDPHGAATLTSHIAQSSWDQGWDFDIGFSSSRSRVDAYIMALGGARYTPAAQPILDKAKQLNPSSAFSHHRAVGVALEQLQPPQAAPILAELLNKPGMSGHHAATVEQLLEAWKQQDYNGKEIRKLNLRELILARALYRCGDHHGLAETILRAYTHDLRGLYARHARAVLQSGQTR